MRLREALTKQVERLTRTTPPEQRAQAQLFVRSWLTCLPILAATGSLYALTGLWGQALIQVAAITLGLANLGFFFKTKRLRLSAHLSLGIGSLTFAAGALAQSPTDVSSVAWLGLAPLIAALIEPASALAWLLTEIVLAVSVVLLGHAGYHLEQFDPQPQVTTAINLALMFSVMALFGWHYRKRIEAQARAEAANRAKQAFLATISHEIRTPMNGIIGMTELLVEDERDATRRGQLRTILRSGQLLVQLVNDMLDFTKVETGKLTLEPADTDVLQLARDLEALFEPLAVEKSLGLVLELQGDVPRVHVDALRLRQVLSNLLNNALKFTLRGSVVLEVRAEPTAAGRASLCFAVRDSGPGIEASVLPRMFLPFEQGDSSTARRYGGVGLGLAISNQLVGLLGGELRVETSPGHGSRFWFTLGLPLAKAPLMNTPSRGHRSARAAAFPVLVVDDNPINLKVATALVTRAGFEVVTAANGEEALAALNGRRFCAVLMDCHMPVIDGFECSRRIHALGGDVGRTPVIAVSASAAPDDVAACTAAGMCDFVAKPISYRALVDTLDRHVVQH